VLERHVLEFQPNAILYVGHPGDQDRVLNFVATAAIARKPTGYEFVDNMARRAGVEPTDRQAIAMQKLRPFGGETLLAVHRRIASSSRNHGLCAGWMLLPMIDAPPNRAAPPPEIAVAHAAGFTVLDLSDVYVGTPKESLWLAPWDGHPNAAGHRLVSDRLYTLMKDKARDLLYCGEPTADPPGQSAASNGHTP
jgi:hypothetical protein